MMPMALLAVWLELRVLSWLMIVEEEPDEPATFGAMVPPGYRPPAKKDEKESPGPPSE
jgi:hypothetical protein